MLGCSTSLQWNTLSVRHANNLKLIGRDAVCERDVVICHIVFTATQNNTHINCNQVTTTWSRFPPRYLIIVWFTNTRQTGRRGQQRHWLTRWPQLSTTIPYQYIHWSTVLVKFHTIAKNAFPKLMLMLKIRGLVQPTAQKNKDIQCMTM